MAFDGARGERRGPEAIESDRLPPTLGGCSIDDERTEAAVDLALNSFKDSYDRSMINVNMIVMNINNINVHNFKLYMYIYIYCNM